MTNKTSTVIAEVRKGVFHPIATKIRGLQLLKRRVRQFGRLLFSKDYCEPRSIADLVSSRYSQTQEIEYYRAIAHLGLYKEEQYICEQVIKQLKPKHPLQFLVVGAGAGREALGLARLNLEVTAIDNSALMIQHAKELAATEQQTIQFEVALIHELNTLFDCIFVSYALLNHFIFKSERLKFLEECKNRLRPGGIIICGVHIQKIQLFDRFYWASKILKFRFKNSTEWQPGITARSHLGHHNAEETPLPFYFYSSFEDYASEVSEANLKILPQDIPQHIRESGYDSLIILVPN